MITVAFIFFHLIGVAHVSWWYVLLALLVDVLIGA